MKKKTLVVVLLCALSLAPIFISNANATVWFEVSFNQVGVIQPNYWVSITDTASTPSFTNRSFVIDSSSGMGKEMLATALTAISNGSTAWVELGSTSPYALVFSIMAK